MVSIYYSGGSAATKVKQFTIHTMPGTRWFRAEDPEQRHGQPVSLTYCTLAC